jgi:tetratricopeptide (TPR) repeat protein
MLVSAGRDDDALSQVNQILLEQPYRTDALRLMAIINFRLGHMDVAKADFEDLLASGNYRMDALYYLGRIADKQSKPEEAIEHYSQVTSGDNAVHSQSRTAYILAQQGEHDKALEHLTTFAEINTNFAVDMLRAKAQLLVTIEREDEALELFDQVVAYRPDNESIQLGRAALLLKMGRTDDAIGQYRRAVERWPESSMSLNALGYTLADLTDQYDEAQILIRKALDMEPDSAAIIDSWGWVLYRQGRSEEALAFLEEAYEKLRDPEVAAHIVQVLLSLDRPEDAGRMLQEAEVLFPDSELLKKLRAKQFPETP